MKRQFRNVALALFLNSHEKQCHQLIFVNAFENCQRLVSQRPFELIEDTEQFKIQFCAFRLNFSFVIYKKSIRLSELEEVYTYCA